MTNSRTYGAPPFSIALVHGGPGATGDMAPVARELSKVCGVLEPLQTEATVDDQVYELAQTIRGNTGNPVVLAGHSWGAWLALLVAAQYPSLVRTLILIGSGPFEERYAAGIMKTRYARLSPAEREEARKLGTFLSDPLTGNDPAAFARFGALMEKADSFDPLPATDEQTLDFRPDLFHTVWPDAARLRRSGELLDAARRIRCPVIAIHGDHDPHPVAGVQEPLAEIIHDFRFILLKHCGHKPWNERQAREQFYEIVIGEAAG